MTEQKLIRLTEAQYQALQSLNGDVVLKFIKGHKKDIIELLNAFYYEARSKVDDVSLDDLKLNNDSGIFKATYELNSFNACSDVRYAEPSHMNIHFNINLQERTITLISEERLERDPDEF